MAKPDYDVVIIGAGISGLVCGCYLAKAGLKTLIVEKNAYPGGYCCSFMRQGYRFDACAHALSSLREGGLLYRILNDLGLTDRLRFIRHNPTDAIITPKFRINIYNDYDEFKEEFMLAFPMEKESLNKFFNYAKTTSFFELRSKTFAQFLDSFFSDVELKAVFSTLMLQFLGMPPDKLSATVACLLWKEFILDGGYYPEGGLQVFPATLAKKFIELGGNVMFSRVVERIKVENNIVNGIVLKDGQEISVKYVVVACDVRQTLFDLIGEGHLSKKVIDKVKSMVVSSSGFLVYAGINKADAISPQLITNYYVSNSLDFNEIYSGLINAQPMHLAITSSTVRDHTISDKPAVCLATNALYFNNDFWDSEKKQEISERLIALSEKIIPGFRNNISLIITAAPTTLYKWTHNYQGAGYGWASTVEQFGDPDFSQRAFIKNLYLTGHWTNLSSGIPFVANCGREAAKLIALIK